ncbi:hypothetical protein CC1G_13893 [Coprinopsis cinerea okayama7|uniref:Uncharacterized protein n=1 Tax=Coprinopsis cinerea (strain Okayama-7 / 130 / ATCC MYA-4618 / FGSC 9003) TaxID=240176 RepID=D6RKM7_COPC7|nr:hypothetical protein CC1G_13893 [Coprinopsis cinerea okayama7\|eukprot:XP_002911853.1 hypothetical protein CC1G_13893 [Coprinopsis cinerea okayama7\
MPSALQSRITAFESLAGGSSSHATLNSSPPPSPKKPRASNASSDDSLIDAPLSAATAAALPPVAFSSPAPQTKTLSPSPSPPILGRKTSLIDLTDWIVDDDPVLAAPPLNGAPTLKPKPVIVKRASVNGLRDGKTPTQRAFNTRVTSPNGLLINLESPPRPKVQTTNGKAAPPLPPRKTASYTSLKSVASTSSSQSSGPSPNSTFLYPPRRGDSLTVDSAHAYPPSSPLNIDTRSSTRHTAGSSISSFHSVSLSSDTDPSTPNSLSNFIASYPGDHASEADTASLADSFEDVSASSLASPATERMISMDFERARALRGNGIPPKLPQRPTSNSSGFSTPSSARSSMKSPPPVPPSRSSQTIRGGSSTPRSIPGSPVIHPTSTNYVTPIPTTYAVRRPPPLPPSRASDRSSVQSNATTFSISSASTQSHRPLSRTNTLTSISSTNSSSRVIQVKRPTPVPAAARKRYEAVFNGNVIQRRRAEKRQRKLTLMKLQGNGEENSNGLLSPNEFRGRRAAGWRGLSVDLITGDPDSVAQQLEEQNKQKKKEQEDVEQVNEFVDKDERLEGVVVKLIWKRSGLDKKRLAEIWCAPRSLRV